MTKNPYILIVTIVISFSMFACNSARKAQRQLVKIDTQHPIVLTDYIHKYYPPIVKPISKDTTNRPDSSLQVIIDSLRSQATTYKRAAKYALNRADSAILASYRNKDTACANLLIHLRQIINRSNDRVETLTTTLSSLQRKYDYLLDHPQTIITTVSVLDSGTVRNLNLRLKNVTDQLNGKNGEIKQLKKSNTKKTIAIVIMGIICTGGIYFSLKS